jgi:hypothetical protein
MQHRKLLEDSLFHRLLTLLLLLVARSQLLPTTLFRVRLLRFPKSFLGNATPLLSLLERPCSTNAHTTECFCLLEKNERCIDVTGQDAASRSKPQQAAAIRRAVSTP